MAQLVDTVTHHVFAFDDVEIARILNALHGAGDGELANEIWSQLDGCDCDGEGCE